MSDKNFSLTWRELFFAAGLAWISFCFCTPAKNYLDPDGPKFTGRFASKPPGFNDTLKVVSFNIKFAREIALAIQELSEFAELREADILFLQEMDEAGTEAIARALAYNYVYYPATLHPQSGRNFGNAILSRWPMKNEKKILLPHEAPGSRTRRIAVRATIAAAPFEILAYSTHTATFIQGEVKRLMQADSLLRSIANDYPRVIVAGDFNTMTDESLHASHFLFRKNGFVQASHSAEPTGTARPLPFGATLDHIYVKGLRPVSAGRVKASRASDHLPIWAKLVME